MDLINILNKPSDGINDKKDPQSFKDKITAEIQDFDEQSKNIIDGVKKPYHFTFNKENSPKK